MNTKDYNATLDLAVSAILDGQVLKGCSLKLANGKMIREQLAPDASPRWGLFCHKNGLDFLAHQEPSGIINVSVGKPNTHWMKREHFIIY